MWVAKHAQTAWTWNTLTLKDQTFEFHTDLTAYRSSQSLIPFFTGRKLCFFQGPNAFMWGHAPTNDPAGTGSGWYFFGYNSVYIYIIHIPIDWYMTSAKNGNYKLKYLKFLHYLYLKYKNMTSTICYMTTTIAWYHVVHRCYCRDSTATPAANDVLLGRIERSIWYHIPIGCSLRGIPSSDQSTIINQ